MARRLLILVAVLMGVTALAVSVAPPPPPEAPVVETTPTPEVSETGGALAGEPGIVERTLKADEGAGATVIEVPAGRELRLTVESQALDSVELVGLDRLRPVTPEAPAVFDVLPDRTGTYPIVLVDADRTVGRLRVTPR